MSVKINHCQSHNKPLVALSVVLLALLLTACSWAKEDRDDCPECVTGVQLQLATYMEPSAPGTVSEEVRVAQVYVFDDKGTYLGTHTFNGDYLAANNCAITIQLDPGKYFFTVWTGLDQTCCQVANIAYSTPFIVRGDEIESSKMPFLRISRDLFSRQGQYIAPIWEGSTEQVVEVMPDCMTYTTITMMRMVNNIVCVVQDAYDQPISTNDYSMSITASNGLMDFEGTVHDDSRITYTPYLEQDAKVEDVTVARAELNTMRLYPGDDARLHIARRDNGKEVLNVSLTPYLLLVREQYEGRIGRKYTDQQYLDAVHHHSIILFLKYDKSQGDEGQYMLARVMVNGWIVRLNDDLDL